MSNLESSHPVLILQEAIDLRLKGFLDTPPDPEDLQALAGEIDQLHQRLSEARQIELGVLIHDLHLIMTSFLQSGEPFLDACCYLMREAMALTSMIITGRDPEITLTEIAPLRDRLSLFLPDEVDGGDKEEFDGIFDPSSLDDPMMLELFIDEAGMMIDDLSNDLIHCEDTADEEALHRLFRNMHTLKGSSGIIGLRAVNELAHSAENLLELIRNGELSFRTEITTLLLQAVDRFGIILNRLNDRLPVQMDNSDILQAIQHFVEHHDESDRRGKQEPRETARPKPADLKQQEEVRRISPTIRVDVRKLDQVMNLIRELVIHKIRLDQKFLDLTGQHQEIRALAGHLNSTEHMRILRGIEAALQDHHCSLELRTLLQEIPRHFQAIQEVTANLPAMLTELDDQSAGVRETAEFESTLISDLQEGLLKLRMIPIAQTFKRFPRLVRDLANHTGKKVNLLIDGEETEIDKTIVEEIGDPLMHILRNCVDHGIEYPEKRQSAGKPETGTIRLSAAHQGNQVIVRIEDDGGGIDPQRCRDAAIRKELMDEHQAGKLSDKEARQLIFHPGFSTAGKITETSGRGVGMDVVQQTIRALNGQVELHSEIGQGTTFIIRFPLTLAIIQTLLIRIQNEKFAIPLNHVEETIQISRHDIRPMGSMQAIELRGQIIRCLDGRTLLSLPGTSGELDSLYLVILRWEDELLAVAVDELIGRQEVVIKSLGDLIQNAPLFSGATILGDGRVILILNVATMYSRSVKLSGLMAQAPPEPVVELQPGTDDRSSILIIDDSISIRHQMKNILARAGYRVIEATDGQEGLEVLNREPVQLVTVDLMMPRMNGFEFTERLRADKRFTQIPVVMVTSRDTPLDKERGLAVGADEYVIKPFNDTELVKTVMRLVR